MKVFAFLDLEHPPVAWAVMRGMLVSATYVPTPVPGFVSFMTAGMIRAANGIRLSNELAIENVRIRNFAKAASRIRGMYFFRSREEAELKIGDRDWPWYFTGDNLLELDLQSFDSVIEVDANWITHAPRDHEGKLSDSAWITQYWEGQTHDGDPTWEIIANGIAVVPDEAVRRRAHDLLSREFPDASIPILMARMASESGGLGGLTAPYVSLRRPKCRLDYLWRDAEFHDPEMIEKIARHPDAPLLGRMMVANETWRMPDLRPWGTEFDCDFPP